MYAMWSSLEDAGDTYVSRPLLVIDYYNAPHVGLTLKTVQKLTLLLLPGKHMGQQEGFVCHQSLKRCTGCLWANCAWFKGSVQNPKWLDTQVLKPSAFLSFCQFRLWDGEAMLVVPWRDMGHGAAMQSRDFLVVSPWLWNSVLVESCLPTPTIILENLEHTLVQSWTEVQQSRYRRLLNCISLLIRVLWFYAYFIFMIIVQHFELLQEGGRLRNKEQ